MQENGQRTHLTHCLFPNYHFHSPPHHQHRLPLPSLTPSPASPLPSSPPPPSSVNYRPLFFPQRGTPSGRREPLFWNGGSWLNSPRCESDLHVAESAGSLWELEQSLYEVGTHAGWSKAVLNLFFFSYFTCYGNWLQFMALWYNSDSTVVMIIYKKTNNTEEIQRNGSLAILDANYVTWYCLQSLRQLPCILYLCSLVVQCLLCAMSTCCVVLAHMQVATITSILKLHHILFNLYHCLFCAQGHTWREKKKDTHIYTYGQCGVAN